jgi:hypothetical protein
MPLKWTIFRIANIVTASFILMFVLAFVNELAGRGDLAYFLSRYPVLFSVLFGSMLSMLLFSLLNLGMLRAGSIEKKLTRSRSVIYIVFFLLTIVTMLLYAVVLFIGCVQTFDKKVIGQADILPLLTIVIFIAIGIYLLVMGYRLKQEIKYAYLETQEIVVDEIGTGSVRTE